METNKIIQGDVLQELRKLPDESIDMVMTSPPYYGLRNYGEKLETIWGGDVTANTCEHKWGEQMIRHLRGDTSTANVGNNKKLNMREKEEGSFCQECGAWKGQLGLEPTFDLYLENMLLITAEIQRVLKKGGNVFWNHGDSYSGLREMGTNDNGGSLSGLSGGKTKAARVSEKTGRGRAKSGIPLKSLMGQAWRLAIAMTDKQGWILRSDIKWIKQILIWKEKRTMGSVMPTSVDDRFNMSGEYLFHFVKNDKYYFNLGAIKIKAQESEKERPRIGQVNLDGSKVHFNIREQVETGERKRPPAFMASPAEFNKEWKDKKEKMYGNDDALGRRSRVRAFLNTKSKYSKELPNAQPDGRAHFNTGKALHDYYKDKGIDEKFIYKKNIPNAWLIGTEPSKEKHFAQ